MFADPKRVLMGGGVLAAIVLAMWMMWPATPAPSASVQSPAPARGGPPQAKGAPVAPVKLDALATDRREPSDGARNPFRFQPRVAAPPPRTALAPASPVAGLISNRDDELGET